MAYKQDNLMYFGLDFNPKTPQEALEALKKIKDCHQAYKPDVANAALKYFDVITSTMAFCDWREYLTGEIYSKMSVLAGNLSKSFINSQSYINAFYVAIGLMIKALF